MLDNQKFWIKDEEKKYKDLKVLVKATRNRGLRRKEKLTISFIFEFINLKINNLCQKVKNLRNSM